MKVEIARFETMPKLAAETGAPGREDRLDPASIRCPVWGRGCRGGGNGADKPAINQALDSILGMAVQLPAMKKIGEELGLSLEGGLGAIKNGSADGTTLDGPSGEEPAALDRADERSADQASGDEKTVN